MGSVKDAPVPSYYRVSRAGSVNTVPKCARAKQPVRTSHAPTTWDASVNTSNNSGRGKSIIILMETALKHLATTMAADLL